MRIAKLQRAVPNPSQCTQSPRNLTHRFVSTEANSPDPVTAALSVIDYNLRSIPSDEIDVEIYLP